MYPDIGVRFYLQWGVWTVSAHLHHNFAPFRVLSDRGDEEESLSLHNVASRKDEHFLLRTLLYWQAFSRENRLVDLQFVTFDKNAVCA